MRVASCRCGNLIAECDGEPLRVSVCHCLACQGRTGSAFAVQARFPANDVRIKGDFRTFERLADSGRGLTHRFCPICGATIAYKINDWPDVIAVPLGLFGNATFPAPALSIYERRKASWVSIEGAEVDHHA
jgi:hypothetical protein